MNMRFIPKKISVVFHDSLSSDNREQKKAFYLRSAYRNDPEFQISQLQQRGDPLDENRVKRMIDNDEAVSRNYQKLVCEVFDIFEAEPQNDG